MNMNVMKFKKYGTHIGVVKSRKPLFDDEQGFLEFLLQAREEADADLIIIEKTVLPEKFFDINSGFAVVINQKLINYRSRMAVVGDFTVYNDKTLDDFVKESNNGEDLVFLRSINEAVSYFAD